MCTCSRTRSDRPAKRVVSEGAGTVRPLMYGRVFGVAVIGVQGHLIRVEAHVGRGLPSLTVAGLPGTGVYYTTTSPLGDRTSPVSPVVAPPSPASVRGFWARRSLAGKSTM